MVSGVSALGARGSSTGHPLGLEGGGKVLMARDAPPLRRPDLLLARARLLDTLPPQNGGEQGPRPSRGPMGGQQDDHPQRDVLLEELLEGSVRHRVPLRFGPGLPACGVARVSHSTAKPSGCFVSQNATKGSKKNLWASKANALTWGVYKPRN